jgi:hypothetical protein
MTTIITKILQVIIIVLMASKAYALDVFLNTQITGANRPVIRVKTNLPDATKVVITVSNESLNYSEQIPTEVAAGTFEGGPFQDKGAAICPGIYNLSITVELAQFQTPSVQAVIGRRGEELEGSLVHKGMLGKKVFYSTRFEVI